METLIQSMPSWLKTSELAFDPVAFGRMKAEGYNRNPGNLTGYDCKKCRNKGNAAEVREDGGLYFAECACMNIRKCVWKMERSGLKNIIPKYPFSTFTTGEHWQAHMKDTAEAFARSPEGWLVICGQSGSGKTHLCVSVCRELLLAGRQVVYMPWMSDIAEIKGMAMEPEARKRRMDAMKEAECLYIDDLFKSGNTGENRPTGADVRIAFEIVNQRYLDGKTTILSTELMPEELIGVDEATGGRILEMAGANCLTIGRDLRKNHRLQGARL